MSHFLLVMARWSLVKDFGVNYPQRTCIVLVFLIFGVCTIAYQQQGMKKWVKETGQTAHVERLNNTFRQRIARLVRKTLSFSKKEYMLHLQFKMFAFYYNLECIT
ncbi:MAG: hypothetical protein HC892_11435 [Saprospiraceae bacterium]|nr:hypothetical protein [Saprospiraceae bacterium]